MDAAPAGRVVGCLGVVNRSARRSLKSTRRHARKHTAAVRRQRRYGADDRVEYELTQPLWVIEALLGCYAHDGERKSA